MVRILEERILEGNLRWIKAAGLSTTDTKPTTGIVTGSRFFEVDTGSEYAYDEESAQWELIGLTSEEMTAAIVDWLDEHPEATTTVEDGAVGYAKLDSTLQGVADSVMAVSVSSNTLVMAPVIEED